MFSETDYPTLAGWSSVRALVSGRWKLIQTTSAALFDLDATERAARPRVGPARSRAIDGGWHRPDHSGEHVHGTCHPVGGTATRHGRAAAVVGLRRRDPSRRAAEIRRHRPSHRHARLGLVRSGPRPDYRPASPQQHCRCSLAWPRPTRMPRCSRPLRRVRSPRPEESATRSSAFAQRRRDGRPTHRCTTSWRSSRGITASPPRRCAPKRPRLPSHRTTRWRSMAKGCCSPTPGGMRRPYRPSRPRRRPIRTTRCISRISATRSSRSGTSTERRLPTRWRSSAPPTSGTPPTGWARCWSSSGAPRRPCHGSNARRRTPPSSRRS